MELKKNPKYRLENYSMLFFEVGLALSLLIAFFILESRTYRSIKIDFGDSKTVYVEEMDIPQTERLKEKLILPKAPPPVTEIRIVANNVELEQELILETTEIDEDFEVNIIDNPLPVENIEDDEEEIFNFQVVESQAVFPGCENYQTTESRFMCFQQKIMKHITDNFSYPEIARELGIQGRVIVSFVISSKGEITNVSILRGIDKNLDKEALRIVKLLPKMTPASQRGKNVPVSFIIPITFKLQ